MSATLRNSPTRSVPPTFPNDIPRSGHSQSATFRNDIPRSAQRETTEASGESISDTEDPFEELNTQPVTKRGPKTSRKRSAHQFSGELRPMVEAATNHIESITLFKDPLPDPKDSQVILDKVRGSGELRYGTDVQRDVKIDSYICFEWLNCTIRHW